MPFSQSSFLTIKKCHNGKSQVKIMQPILVTLYVGPTPIPYLISFQNDIQQN